ncbi:MAG: hypothetical protein V9F03_14335 [Microthrixaceae bacterium]
MTSTERTETERADAAVNAKRADADGANTAADDHGPAYFPFRARVGFGVGQSASGGVVALDVTKPTETQAPA